MRRRTLAIVVSIVVASAVIVGFLLQSFMQLFERIALGYVAVIELSGVISYRATVFGGEGITPSDFRYYMDRIAGDPAARAVVLIINSPGGSAAASEEIYQLMKRLAESRIVVVYASEVLASGGYYISLPAHRIVASQHALVGSIGSVMMLYSVDELLNKLGINVTIIKSGEFKDIGSAFRDPTNEEIDLLRGIVNRSAQIFIDRVRRHRNVSSDVFTAKIYTGVDSVEVGLIDEIGALEDAIELAKKLANIPPHAPEIRIEKPKGLLELILEGIGMGGIVGSANMLSDAVSTEFINKVLYLWIPGE